MDQMITRDLGRRFTARQALDFLEGFASKITDEELQLPAPPPATFGVHHFNRWEGLPDEFIKGWEHFRERKPSFWTRLLGRISAILVELHVCASG